MSKRTCKFSDCVKPVFARKMCSTHWGRWRSENPGAVRKYQSNKGRVCSAAGCSEEARSRGLCVSHYSRLYWRLSRERALERKRAETTLRLRSTVKSCKQCGQEFSPKRSMAQRYCSDFCSRKWRRENAPGECKVAECVSVVKARGMCAKHYSAWRRAEGLDTWKAAWTPARKSAYQARRARKRGVDAERVVAVDVFDRDGWLCGICGGEVDSGLEWPDSGSASLDHVVPLSKGGAHTYENTQLAHLFCNVSKGDSLPAGREALSA